VLTKLWGSAKKFTKKYKENKRSTGKEAKAEKKKRVRHGKSRSGPEQGRCQPMKLRYQANQGVRWNCIKKGERESQRKNKTRKNGARGDKRIMYLKNG